MDHSQANNQGQIPLTLQTCDDCKQPMRALAMVLYSVQGPNQGPAQFKSVYYSTDLTVRDIGGYVMNRGIFCDSSAQRGQKDGQFPQVPEYCLADDIPKGYVVDFVRVDEMVKGLEDGSLFGGTLTWNLRPGEACWHYDRDNRILVIASSSRVYLPDSHHRHLAIKKALQLLREDRLKPDVVSKMFTVNIHTMPREGEAQLFYEYNVLGRHADSTRAYVLSQTDPISKVVRQLIDHPPFAGNVETVTNRLSRSSAKMVTFGTLHDAIRDSRKGLGQANEEVKLYSKFFGLLSTVRPEIGTLSAAQRNRVRETLMVDQAVLFHAYVRLAEHARVDLEGAKTQDEKEKVWVGWAKRLEKLRAPKVQASDFFARSSPEWEKAGIVKPSRSRGKLVANTRDTRQQAYELLRDHLGLGPLKSVAG